MKLENKNDLLRIILIINITIILSIKALSFINAANYLPGMLILLANISFIIGITSGIKKQLFLKFCFISSFFYFTVLLLYHFIDDGFLFLETILIIIYSIFYLIIKNKLNKKYNETEAKLKDKTSDLYILSVCVSTLFTIYTVYTQINNYLNKKAIHEQYEKDRIKNDLRWIEEMNYHIDNLSKNHYITGSQLSHENNSVFKNFMKVIEVTDSEIILLKFKSRAYTPVARLMEETYMKYDKKDTVRITKQKLKKTIAPEIRDDLYKHQNGLKKEGIYYTVKDIKYIDGPYLSIKDEHEVQLVEGDTTFFKFKNRNKKAYLTKIENISGNYKWHNKLPMPINGYSLNSRDYNKSAEFSLKATNIDYRQDFRFKLYLEDSLKNKHVFLVLKSSEDNNFITFDCKRVFE